MSYHKFSFPATLFGLALLGGIFVAPASATCRTVKNETLQSAHDNVSQLNLINSWINNTQLIASGRGRGGTSGGSSRDSNPGLTSPTSRPTSGPTSGPTANYIFTNKNKKTVQIDVQGNKIIARGDFDGQVKFRIEEDALYVDLIHAGQRGSGIGTALMYAVAKEAMKNNKDIKVELAAPDAREFYKKMGFELDPDQVKMWVDRTGESEEAVRQKYGHFINMYGNRNTVLDKTYNLVSEKWNG